MKMILSLFLALVTTSCERLPTEAEVNQARERIAELGSNVGRSIEDLESAKEPGKVALAAEDLREDREKLERAILDVQKMIPREEADEIALQHQARTRKSIQKGREEQQAWWSELDRNLTEKRKEIEAQIKRDSQKDPFEGRFVLPE